MIARLEGDTIMLVKIDSASDYPVITAEALFAKRHGEPFDVNNTFAVSYKDSDGYVITLHSNPLFMLFTEPKQKIFLALQRYECPFRRF